MKSERLMPSRAARDFSVPCTESGTFRTWIIFDMLQPYKHVEHMSIIVSRSVTGLYHGLRFTLATQLFGQGLFAVDTHHFPATGSSSPEAASFERYTLCVAST